MKTVFARALVALVPFAVVAVPASAFASSTTSHTHSVARKDTKKKGGRKHHGHKTSAKPASAPVAAAKAT